MWWGPTEGVGADRSDVIGDRCVWLKIPSSTTNTICFHPVWDNTTIYRYHVGCNWQAEHIPYFIAPLNICKLFKIAMPTLQAPDLGCSLLPAYDVLAHRRGGKPRSKRFLLVT